MSETMEIEEISWQKKQQLSKNLDLASRMLRKPATGFQYNPLLSYPRNAPCPCKSGKKFKKCHLPVMPAVIPTEAKIKELEEERKKLEVSKEETKPTKEG